jgi:hypothetical protein
MAEKVAHLGLRTRRTPVLVALPVNSSHDAERMVEL